MSSSEARCWKSEAGSELVGCSIRSCGSPAPERFWRLVVGTCKALVVNLDVEANHIDWTVTAVYHSDTGHLSTLDPPDRHHARITTCSSVTVTEGSHARMTRAANPTAATPANTRATPGYIESVERDSATNTQSRRTTPPMTFPLRRNLHTSTLEQYARYVNHARRFALTAKPGGRQIRLLQHFRLQHSFGRPLRLDRTSTRDQAPQVLSPSRARSAAS